MFMTTFIRQYKISQICQGRHTTDNPQMMTGINLDLSVSDQIVAEKVVQYGQYDDKGIHSMFTTGSRTSFS